MDRRGFLKRSGIALATAALPSHAFAAPSPTITSCMSARVTFEKARIIDGSKVQAGDVLLGLASSGPHSNGYSLIRKILTVSGARLDQPLADGRTLGEALLAPTRIYVKPVLKLLETL